MNEPALLAEHLDGCADAIIAVWHRAVERDDEVPEADRLSYSEFVDHIPALLERLSERLRGLPSDPTTEGREHGRVRWRQGYDISNVVKEMGHLRRALLRATYAYGQAQGFGLGTLEDAVEAIHDVLDEAVAESVAQFQEDSLATTRSAREESEQRRRAGEEAREAAEAERLTLRTLLDSHPVGVWVFEADGTARQINREGERLQGFPAERVIGQFNIHHQQSEPNYRVTRADGTEFAAGELPVLRALRGERTGPEEMIWHLPGGTRRITANAVPLIGSSGAINGATVVIEDITERQQLEAELGASEARFRTIVDQSPVMIWRAGIDGNCDYFNRRWLDFRGRTHEHDLSEGVHPDDRQRVVDSYWAAFHARRPFVREYRLLRRDGEYRWITDHGIPYYGAGDEFLGYLGSCIDITDRHELEDSLKGLSEAAQEASHHKTRLLAALSHDVRTPLNAVVLSTQLLELHTKDGAQNPEADECLRTIRNSVKNVLDLLSDLLDLSRIDAGATPVEVSKFEIEPMMEECLSSIEGQARQKGLECRIDIDGLVAAIVETDRAKLKQILSNFLSNALRYTERGHIRVFGEITTGHVRISVEDTGIGIDLADQTIIFDEFATLNKPHRPSSDGTGLGLAICRRLAGLLKGQIELHSAPGRGSTFTLVLPDSILASGPAFEADVPAAVTSAQPTSTGPIVVAEDDPANRQVLGRVLRRLGFRVLEADNGRDAIALIESERPLAVLMDVNMPVLDGIQATIALRSDPRFRDLPIFALTGDVSVINRRRIGDAGVDGYLEKPVTLEILRRTLGSLTQSAAG